jgi:hypothetical protein
MLHGGEKLGGQPSVGDNHQPDHEGITKARAPKFAPRPVPVGATASRAE